MQQPPHHHHNYNNQQKQRLDVLPLPPLLDSQIDEITKGIISIFYYRHSCLKEFKCPEIINRILLKILNANPGLGAPLNEQETRDFLTASKLNAHLGTVDEKGDANIHPAWYFYDASNDKIYVETSKQSKKTYNLRRKESVYFCIDDPNFPYKGVRGKGSVKIHEDINFNVPIAEKIMVKYLGNIEHLMAQALLDMQKKGQSVILEISPKYFSTWDDSKQ